MDHVPPPEADVLEDVPSDKLHDSKHAADFILNEVQSYDNVFTAKSKSSEMLENGDQLSENEQHSPVAVHVDLMNGSHESKPLPSTPPEGLESNEQLLTDISHSTPGHVFSSPNTDLLRDVADISPIKTFDLVDMDTPSHKNELQLDEAKLFQTDPVTERVDAAQFQHHEKAVDHMEEPIKPTKPSGISVVPDTCDLISNKPTEIKSTPSPVEAAVTVAAEPSEPKIAKEATETIKFVKAAITAKANPLEKSEIGPKDFFAKYGLDTWFNPERLDPTVEAYIYWRDPKLSGIIFGGGLVLLLSLAYFSLISVVANAGLAILTCAIVFRIYKDIMQAVQKTPQTHPYSVFLNRDIALPQEKVHELIDTLILHINACLGELRRLFLVEDMIESLKFALVLWILTYVGSWFNGLTLVIIGFVALFTLPKVYENNKVQIDQNLALVRAKVEELANKIREALPAPLRRKVPEKKE